MSHYTLSLRFIAPIPVGHRIRIDFYSHDVAIVGTKMEIDSERPVVTDLETGIQWRSSSGTGGYSFHKSYYGRVVACEIESQFASFSWVESKLAIDPMEPPS